MAKDVRHFSEEAKSIYAIQGKLTAIPYPFIVLNDKVRKSVV